MTLFCLNDVTANTFLASRFIHQQNKKRKNMRMRKREREGERERKRGRDIESGKWKEERDR